MHYVAEGDFADKPELLVLINMERGDVTFTLPGGRSWGRLIDTQTWFDMPATETQRGQGGWFDDNTSLDPYRSANISLDAPEIAEEPTWTVRANSIVVLEQQD